VNLAGGTTTTINCTTTSTNDIICLVVTTNSAHVTNVSSTNTTGWVVSKSQNTGGGNFLDVWYGTASSTLTSESITVTFSATSAFVTLDVFGISGGNTSTPQDASGPVGGTTSTVTLVTSNANDFCVGAYRFVGTANPTAGSTPSPGWTKISGADFQLVEYQVVSATQSGMSVTIGTGNGDENAGIATAFQAAAGGATRPVKMAGEWGGYAGESGGFAG
jgi:hypothetical protein